MGFPSPSKMGYSFIFSKFFRGVGRIGSLPLLAGAPPPKAKTDGWIRQWLEPVRRHVWR